MTSKVGLIRGDGTGPELVEAALKVVSAVNSHVEFVECEAGYEWWTKHGGPSMIPDKSWRILEESSACLKGPATTPAGPGTPRSVAVSIRQRFDLYANVRPIKTFRGTAHRLGDVDFVCVREATEGLYSGVEHRITPDVAIAFRKVSRISSERVARKGFELAKDLGWKQVIAITKQNILKETDGLFMEAVRSAHNDFPDITVEEYYIDNVAQQLVKNPQRFNQHVLLGTNLFMDIVSEEAAGLVASIGCIYSANLGDKYAMFEPAHGSAAQYRGQDKVNPTAMILAAAWMLEYLGDKRRRDAIFAAVEDVIAEGRVVTYDLGGKARLSEMAAEIAERARKHL